MRLLYRAAWLATLILVLAPTARSQSYRISLTNLTNGQPFSPYVFATHNTSESLWEPGQNASPGLRQIAEEGDNTVLLSDLNSVVGSSVGTLAAGSGLLLPGGHTEFLLSTEAAFPFLSSAWMLGWTNDGFSGFNAFDLRTVTGTVTLDLVAYDAGTEVNNESALFLAPLGGTLNDPENGVIHPHPGIAGNADIPAFRNWSDPVARLQITAVPEPGALVLMGASLCMGGTLCLRRRRP